MNPKVGTVEWWESRTQVDPETGCVLYTRARPDGYAQVRWGGRHVLVHRLAYEQVNGEIPQGFVLCHRCDTPNCVNPEHLSLGTQKDNLRDMFAKGRARPRGKTTSALTDFPTVSGRVDQALAKSPAREQWLTRWHSTSYMHCRDGGAMADSCSSATPATEQQQIRAVLFGNRPQSETEQPAPERLPAVATVASSCLTCRDCGKGAPQAWTVYADQSRRCHRCARNDRVRGGR